MEDNNSGNMNNFFDPFLEEMSRENANASAPRTMSIWFKLNQHEDVEVPNLSLGKYAQLKKFNSYAMDYVTQNLLHILKENEQLESVYKSTDQVTYDLVFETIGISAIGTISTRIVPDPEIPAAPDHTQTNDNLCESNSNQLNDRTLTQVQQKPSSNHFKARLQAYRHTDDVILLDGPQKKSSSVDCDRNNVSVSTLPVMANAQSPKTVLTNISNTQVNTSHVSSCGEKKSPIWDHCKKIKKDRKEYLHCFHCNKDYPYQKNTTNMLTHLTNIHGLIFPKVNAKNQEQKAQKLPSPTQPAKKFCTSSQKNSTPSIQSTFQNMMKYQAGGSKDNEITNDILFMTCKDLMPMSTVEREGFRYFVKKAYPLYHIPSRFTMTSKLENKYELLKNKLVDKLIKCKDYCITADNWSDRRRKTYMGITAHYLDPETLKFEKACLGCLPLDERHTAEYLESFIRQSFKEFGIEIPKITAMLTDSEAAIKKAAIAIVGEDRHLACLAHATSHVIPDTLTVSPDVQNLVEKVKKIVTLIRKSGPATDKLIKSQIDDKDNKEVTSEKDALVFIQDCPTRWTSTIDLLERYVILEPYVYSAMSACNNPIDLLTLEETKLLKEILPLMKPVRDVITEISGDSYPTASIIIPIIHCARKTIAAVSPNLPIAKLFQKNLLSKMQQRYGKIEENMNLACATILDPRFKKLHFECQSLANRAVRLIDRSLRQMKPKDRLINEASQSNSKSKSSSLWEVHDALVNQQLLRVSAAIDEGDLDRELETYLKLPLIDRHSDIFKYWKAETLSFPNLSIVAMKRLPILATTVPSERLFSVAGLINTPKRTQTTGKHLNMLVFLGTLSAEDWGLHLTVAS